MARRYLWLLFVLSPFVSRGDERGNVNPIGAIFPSPGGTATLVLDKSGERALVQSGLRSYSIQLGRDRAENGDFHVSPDGRTVLFLRKRAFLGRMLDDPRTQGLRPNPVEGLALWRDGKLLVSRSWEALLTRRTMFGRSVSHLHWILDARIDWKAGEATLVTTSYRRYRLRLNDGRFLEENDLPSFVAAPRIAYGVVQRSRAGEELHVHRWDKGSGPMKLDVRREAGSPDVDVDAFWIVPEPKGGVATIREFVDEVTEAQRRAASYSRSNAPRHFARLLVGTRAFEASGDVEFRRAAENEGTLLVDVREWNAATKALYEVTLLVPVRLPKENSDPLITFLDKGLVYESGLWTPVRVRADAQGASWNASVKEIDATFLFRSPARDDLVEVRLVANPYVETRVRSADGKGLEQALSQPPRLARFRWVDRR
jgi:hypothetical protein